MKATTLAGIDQAPLAASAPFALRALLFGLWSAGTIALRYPLGDAARVWDIAILPIALFLFLWPSRDRLRLWLVWGGLLAFGLLAVDLYHGLTFYEFTRGLHQHVVVICSAFVALDLAYRLGIRRVVELAMVAFSATAVFEYLKPSPDLLAQGTMSVEAWILKFRFGHFLILAPILLLARKLPIIEVACIVIGVLLLAAGDARMYGTLYILAGMGSLGMRVWRPRVCPWAIGLFCAIGLPVMAYAAGFYFTKIDVYTDNQIERFTRSNWERIDLAGEAWDHICVRPFAGHGSFSERMLVDRPGDIVVESQVHSIILSLWMQYGLVGLAFSICMLAIAGYGLGVLLTANETSRRPELIVFTPILLIFIVSLLTRLYTSVYKIEHCWHYGMTLGFAAYLLSDFRRRRLARQRGGQA